MEVGQDLHMKGGLDDTSYANNSSFQKMVILRVKEMLEESVTKVYCTEFPECLRIADLGCSSGPNTLVVVSEILDTIESTCLRLNVKPPVFQFFLNDLPGNDFNSLFLSLGSFYKMFPNNSVHFVHSSYCLHWLPQVPKGLVNAKGEALNKGNILVSNTSPPEVLEAYLNEFRKGFTLFLRCRSQELVRNGGMLLTLSGRIDKSKTVFEMVGRTLNDMVLEGIVDEEKADHFNLQYYQPSVEEVKREIDIEGSFFVQKIDVFEVDLYAILSEANRDNNGNVLHTKINYVVDNVKAVLEPIIVTQFGQPIADKLFQRFAVKVAESFEIEKWPIVTLVFSLTKK